LADFAPLEIDLAPLIWPAVEDLILPGANKENKVSKGKYAFLSYYIYLWTNKY